MDGFSHIDEEGAFGYGGRLNIRPPYQREFIYNDKQQQEVIRTIKRNLPLNVFYWALSEDGNFEMIDGQQRTLSACHYLDGRFAFKDKYFNNLQDDQRQPILDYELTVFICDGGASERLEWFEIINLAGEKLADQELRNAIYAGTFISDARRYFSKRNSPASKLAYGYMKGDPLRQDYLEAVLKWVSGDNIEAYMALHQHDENAEPLWAYFEEVIAWVKSTFTKTRTEMRTLEWGELYHQFKDEPLDPEELEAEIAELMQDEDVSNKKGIYLYVLTRDQKHLNLRSFNDRQKREAFERQNGICALCNKQFEIKSMEADHITPWHEGGKTDTANCQLLCVKCNRRKGGR